MFLTTESTRSIYFLLLILTTNLKSINSIKCNRTPEGHGAPQTPADGRFHIRILENTDKYTPGKTYTIKLEGIAASSSPPVKHKFFGFMLVVERKSNESAIMEHSPSSFGTFTLSHGDTFTKIACADMVTHTSTTPKSEIQVLWTAPQPGSGCVAFKATVIEHRDVWYMDDGPLTKEFCEEEPSFDDTLNIAKECCACEEAKYELTFEGLWSRNTHPKDFPSNNWVTKFSDIIGATHTIDYRFWQNGQLATEGLQQVAEHGTTKELESELKSQSGQIRTIIKAKGLTFPNVTGKTFAVFRVDPKHSVSGLNLCMENCSWAESKALDLSPWDAGTDSGPTYISPDQPTNPPDHIRLITSSSPNDPRSPFYDPTGAKMKPLARLYLTRQRLYEKNCAPGSENESQVDSKNPCNTGPWQESSPCDAECGKGMKHQQREYINEQAARRAGCKKKLTERTECYGRGPNCNDNSDEVDETTDTYCALTQWSDWSECLPRCGNGQKTRTRKYVNKKAKKRCEGGTNYPELMQQIECYTACSGNEEDLQNSDGRDEGQDTEVEITDEPCETSEWSNYGPCSVTCGGGTKTRTRNQISGKCDDAELVESKQCNKAKCEIPDFCSEDPESGNCDDFTNKWFFNWNFTRCDVFSWSCGEHANKFDSYLECTETCTGQTLEFQQNQKKGKKGRNRNRYND